MLINNISTVFKRISHAAMRADRIPEDVTLVAVTKTVDTERIQEAYDAGLRIFGENRVQEAAPKIDGLKNNKGISWHLIGTLQKNKAKRAVVLFDVIESVDSLELAEKINVYAGEMGKRQRIFIQVKLSDEETKYGITPIDVESIIKRVAEMEHVKIDGLMTIPPYIEDAEEVRPYFRRLREMRDDLESRGYDIHQLSMGMSNDYEVAIEEGSTLVRVGTAIFGERVYS